MLLGMLHAKETGISSGRLSLWFMCTFTIRYNTISLLTYPKLGFSKLIYSHQKKPYNKNYNTLKKLLQVIKVN